MTRMLATVIACLGLFVHNATIHGGHPTQTTSPTPSKSPLLGVVFSPIPAVLYSQIPDLPEKQGLLVQSITSDVEAERIGLKKHDIVLRYNDQAVRDVKQLAGLVWFSPPDEKAAIEILRHGKKTVLTSAIPAADRNNIPLSLIKPVGPPSLNLFAKPLPNGKLNVIFTYYPGGNGKLKSIQCSGAMPDILRQVDAARQRQQIPAHIQELMDVALDRLNQRNHAPRQNPKDD